MKWAADAGKNQRKGENMTTQNVSRWLMLKVQTLLSLFTRTRKDAGTLSKPDAQNTTRSIPANLYTHCNECPLDAFIDALVNGNHYRLVKYGTAKKEDIEQAWTYLFYEYCDLSGSKTYRHLFTINKEIGALHSRLLSVRLCLKVLSIHPEYQCVALLKKNGYTCEFNPEDPKQYAKDLETITKKSKTIEIALKEKEHEYEKHVQEYGGKEATENDFTKALVELSAFMGFRINPREITVSEYLAIRQKYEKEAKLLEEANKKLKR